MKLMIRAATGAMLALSSASALADPVDNPGPVTFSVAAGSSAQVGCGMPFMFGGESPPSTIAGMVDGQGNLTLPQASTTFQPIMLMVGPLPVTVQAVATADGSGTINALTGNAVVTLNLEYDLSGPGIPAGCKIPSLTLNLDTTVAGGTTYDMTSGNLGGADITFSVPATSGCGGAGPVIDATFCLPSASGSNQAVFNLSATPVLTGS